MKPVLSLFLAATVAWLPARARAGQDTTAEAIMLPLNPLAGREPIGAEQMTAIERVPVIKRGVKVGYFGSVDKQGKNADWDWWLYKEGNEYVLADFDGPGCIYNLLTYCKDNEAEIRFYFDGKSEPAYVLKVGELGKDDKVFRPPLAQVGFINCRWSMIPMPFRSSCKVTSTVRMSQETRGFGHQQLPGQTCCAVRREADRRDPRARTPSSLDLFHPAGLARPDRA